MNTVDNIIFVLTLVAALGSGLMAGVFFAFSTSVMKALGRLAPAEGMAAMQSINIVIVNPLFLVIFLGTAGVCLSVVVIALIRWDRETAFLLAGAALYLIGSILVTAVFNVPMNNVLAAATPTDAKSAELWANYLSDWTFWNHIRTVASLASTAAFTIGLVYIAK